MRDVTCVLHVYERHQEFLCFKLETIAFLKPNHSISNQKKKTPSTKQHVVMIICFFQLQK